MMTISQDVRCLTYSRCSVNGAHVMRRALLQESREFCRGGKRNGGMCREPEISESPGSSSPERCLSAKGLINEETAQCQPSSVSVIPT